MEVLILWLGTILSSLMMQLLNDIRIYKDIADEGYKINAKKLSDLRNLVSLGFSRISLRNLIIPIVNISSVLKNMLDYDKMSLIKQLKGFNILEEMTTDEKKNYSSNRTGLNAYSVNLEKEISPFIYTLKINDKTCQGEISYKIDQYGDIYILNVTGDLAKLSSEEQCGIVMDILDFYLDSCIETINLSSDDNNESELEINVETENDNERNFVGKLDLLKIKKELLNRYKEVILTRNKVGEQAQKVLAKK